jgi:hypothetical protein
MPRKLPAFPESLKGPGIGPCPLRWESNGGIGFGGFYVLDFESEAGEAWAAAYHERVAALAEFCDVRTGPQEREKWWRELALGLARKLVPAFAEDKRKKGRPSENDSTDAVHACELLLDLVEGRVRRNVTANAVLDRLREKADDLPAWFRGRHKNGIPSKSTLAAALKRAREERARRAAPENLFGLSQSNRAKRPRVRPRAIDASAPNSGTENPHKK